MYIYILYFIPYFIWIVRSTPLKEPCWCTPEKMGCPGQSALAVRCSASKEHLATRAAGFRA